MIGAHAPHGEGIEFDGDDFDALAAGAGDYAALCRCRGRCGRRGREPEPIVSTWCYHLRNMKLVVTLFLLSMASWCAAATFELKATPTTVVWGYYSASAKTAI
jgi:hypothetical protein